MQQSDIIFAYLFGAFLVFITSRGELGTYLGFFGIVNGSGASASSASTPNFLNQVNSAVTSAGAAVNSAVVTGVTGEVNQLGAYPSLAFSPG